MKHTLRAISALTAAILLAALAGACGEDKPIGGPSSGVVRAEIRGPASIAPGASAEYAVVEFLTNGTTRALPSATWTSSDASLVTVTASGVATAQQRNGETVLAVSTQQGKRATKEVLVLPEGTYRMVGRVVDLATNLPIPGVRIEATGGAAATTGTDGSYRLYGVPGEAEIKLTRDDYVPEVQNIQLSGHATRNFVLTMDGSSRSFAGNYTLTVEAAQTCPSQAPLQSDLKRRSYLAIMRQSGSRLEVELTEPRFVARPPYAGNRLTGFITPTGATFQINSDYYYYYGSDVTESLPDGTILSLFGTATTSGSPSGLSGSLNGWFSHMTASYSFLGGCSAGRFTLSPR